MRPTTRHNSHMAQRVHQPHVRGRAATLIRRARLNASPVTRPPMVALRHRGITPADAQLAAYPRSGSTWLRMMLAHALTGVDPDYHTVGTTIPYVGGHQHACRHLPAGGRVIWTHELHRAPCERAVYLVRDPRSVVLSLHRRHLMLGTSRSGIDDFVGDFIDPTSRINRFGTWAQHVRFWADDRRSSQPAVLAVRYEDMHTDPVTTLEAVLAHLGVERTTSQIEAAVHDNSLARMREKERRSGVHKHRPDLSGIGNGRTDGWSEMLSPQLATLIRSVFEPEMTRLRYT